MKDSRCESATMRTNRVLVVMDQYTRRIIGFGVHAGTVDGVALCRMFSCAIRGQRWMPNFLSSDNDPVSGELLFRPRFLGIPCPATILRSAIRPFFSFIATVARLLGPGSVRVIVGESLLKDQLLNVNHFRQRCMKARPDTPNSLYYSNRLCFIN